MNVLIVNFTLEGISEEQYQTRGHVSRVKAVPRKPHERST